MKHSRTTYSFINIATGTGGYFLNTLIGYVCRVVFVRTLGAEYLGISGLFMNIISMLSLAELGVGSAMGYALYKPLAENDKQKIASLMAFYKKAYITIGLVIGLLGLAMMPFLNVIIQEEITIPENIYALYCLFLFNTASSYFFSYRSALLIAAQRNYVVLGVNYAFTIVQSIIQIIILSITQNYYLYLVVQIVTVFINNFVISEWAKHDYPSIKSKGCDPLSKAEKKSLFANVKALTINKLSTILVNNTDNIVITYLSGLISTGLVSNYLILTNTLSTLVKQIFSSLTASVGNLNAIENDSKKYGFFKVLNLSSFWAFGWCAIGIALVSSDIVSLCFGENFTIPLAIPIVIGINFYITGMNDAVYTYKSTMGLFRKGQYLLLVTSAINLLLDFVLGSMWGILGVYLATTIARLCTNVWYEPYAVFKFGLRMSPLLYYKGYIKYLVCLLITGTLCYFTCSLCNFSVLINVIVKLVICTSIPNLIFWIVFHKSVEYKYLLEKISQLIKKIFRKREKTNG